MDDVRLKELKHEYNQLTIKERELERQLREVQGRKVEIQRDIAKNQTAQQEAQSLSRLYEQRILGRRK